MKKIITTIFLIIIGTTMFSQKYTISGYVQDAMSGEKLYSANIYDSRSHIGAISNEYGFFSLTMEKDSIDLVVSYVGYNSFNSKLYLNKDIHLNINLDPNILLGEVVVIDNKADNTVKNVQMSAIELPMAQVKTLPVFMGEADVMKTLQLMPGVQSGSEGSSGIYVRGGGPDQNLILLDGVPVYNAEHLFGFFSVFNPDAISNVTLTKGGFSANYGGRLSSVIDIRLKEGNMKQYSGEVSIGTVASKFTIEGPIIKDKTSFIISGRRTYIDALAAPVIALANKQMNNDSKLRAGYYFYDANIKINHKFSDKDRLYLSAYMGRDKAYIKNEDSYLYYDTTYTDTEDAGLYWGNITTALRWNHIFSNKLFSNATLIFSDYKFDTYLGTESYANDINQGVYKFDYYSGIQDYGAKFDFNYYPTPKHDIRYGGSYTYHIFKPGITTFNQTVENTEAIDLKFGSKNIYGNDFCAYIDDNFSITGRLKANIGFRYAGFLVKDKYYQGFEPRLSARFLITDKLSAKAAITRMNQFIHLLTNSTIGLPTDLWLPSTDSIGPQKSWQAAAGFAYNLNDKWDFTLEGFYKTMNGLIEYKEGASFFSITNEWESKIEIGKGWSYGAEFLVRRNIGKITGWIGYTLSWSWRNFDNLNFGEPFPYKYDRRHDFAIAIIYKKSEKFDIGVTWVYGTGNAVTLATGRYNAFYIYNYQNGDEISYEEVQEYEGRNSFRSPAYHRLDISANLHQKVKLGEITWNFGLYNAYNHQNPFYLYYSHTDSGKRVLKQISLFPIIPSIRFSFKF